MRKAIRVIISMVLASLVLPAILVLIFLFGWIDGRIHDHITKSEVFEYVLKNKDCIELEDSNRYQEFFYSATGLQDGGVEYGYYYAPDDDHCIQGEAYRKGYRSYGIPDDETDWFYSERICENWFYYEIHDG